MSSGGSSPHAGALPHAGGAVASSPFDKKHAQSNEDYDKNSFDKGECIRSGIAMPQIWTMTLNVKTYNITLNAYIRFMYQA